MVDSDPTSTTTGASRQPPALIINLDTALEFSVQCRRYCVDLYRLRGRVDFWDYFASEESAAANEQFAKVWHSWPRPVSGGILALVAETQERLEGRVTSSGELQDALTVMVVASHEHIFSPPGEQSVLQTFIAAVSKTPARRDVRFVLLFNSWDQDVDASQINHLVDAGKPDRFDMAIVLDRKASGSFLPSNEEAESAFIQLRLAIDTLLSPRVAATIVSSLKAVTPPKTRNRVLRMDVVSSDYSKMSQERYSATIMASLEAVHKTKSEQSGSDTFVEDFEERLTSSDAIVSAIANEAGGAFFMHEGDRDNPKALVAERFRKQAKAANLHEPWTRDQTIESCLNGAAVEFLRELDTEMGEALTDPAGVLGRKEELAILERQYRVRELESIGLGALGTGNAAKQNLGQSRAAVERVGKNINESIRAFKEEHASGPVVDAKAKVPTLPRDNIYLSAHWSEVKELFVKLEHATKTIEDLKSRPPMWSWLILNVGLFLAVPLLIAAVWLQTEVTKPAIPVTTALVWLAILVTGLVYPRRLMKRQSKKVNTAIDLIDGAARDLVESIEKRIRSAGEYLGVSQRNYFVKKAGQRLSALSEETDFVESYLETVRRSGAQGRSGLQSSAQEDLVGKLSDQPLENWLDAALRELDLDPGTELQVSMPGGRSSLPAHSRMFGSPIDVRLVSIQSEI